MKTAIEPKPFRKGGKFDESFYVKSYELSREGLSQDKIARALGVNIETMKEWLRRRPALKEAIQKGRERADTSAFERYSFGRLPHRLQVIWERLEETEEQAPGEWIESILLGCDTRSLQRLWLHAFVRSNFRPDTACQKIGLEYKQLVKWLKDDYDFRDLVDELKVARKDFIEGSLLDLVARHDTAAVIFANKCQNADRGYNPAKKVENTNIDKDVIDVNILVELLPIEVVKLVLEAAEKSRIVEQSGALPLKEVYDET